MSTVTQPRQGSVIDLDPNDPFRYGWRYVKETTADGKTTTRQVPLTEEDVLHPQEDDFIMENPLHNDNVDTVRNAVAVRLANKPGHIWLCNCRIDWGIEGIEPLGPDIAVLSGVFGWRRTQEGTFRVAEWNARPLLAFEVTSPSTRNGDLGAKVREYYQARIPLYVIADLIEDENGTPVLRLLCYRAGPNGYVLADLEDPGRLWLEPVGLWLVVEGNHLACFDEQGQRLGDYLHTLHQVTEAKQRADAEKARADAEKARAETETTARQALEARLREIEAELQRARGQQ